MKRRWVGRLVRLRFELCFRNGVEGIRYLQLVSIVLEQQLMHKLVRQLASMRLQGKQFGIEEQRFGIVEQLLVDIEERQMESNIAVEQLCLMVLANSKMLELDYLADIVVLVDTQGLLCWRELEHQLVNSTVVVQLLVDIVEQLFGIVEQLLVGIVEQLFVGIVEQLLVDIVEQRFGIVEQQMFGIVEQQMVDMQVRLMSRLAVL
jgi:hypothetical protein